MSDESTAREGVETEAAPETENKATVEAGPETENDEQDAVETETDPDGTQEEQPEEIEFDFGGNKFRARKDAIPEDIASELDKFSKGIWSDYSRKSGEIAQRSKSLEAREVAVEKMQKLQGDTLQKFSRGLHIRSELEQLAKVDLGALWQSDPDQARRTSDAISQRQAELSSIISDVNRSEQELSQAQQAEVSRRREEGRKVVETAIKGFSEKEIIDYALKQGIPERDVRDWSLNPVVTQMAWKAMLYDRMQAKAASPAAATKPQVKPVVPMKGKGGGGPVDLDKMTPGQMAKHLGLPG